MARIADDILRKVMPHAPERVRAAELPLLNFAAYRHQINTRRRLAMWLANLAQESGELRYQEEIASGKAYEGRTDLGNTHVGDGVRFKGRGRIQGTGRDVYTHYTAYLKQASDVAVPYVDLVANPRKLAQPPYSTDFAGWFVNGYKHLLDEADAGNFLAFCVGINGRNRDTGKPNHWTERSAYYVVALRAIPDGWTLDDDVETVTQDHVNEAMVQSLDNETGYPDYNPATGGDLNASNESRLPDPSADGSEGSEGLETSAMGISQAASGPNIPSGAAPNASLEDKELSPQVITKETPSIFSKVITAITGAIATVIAAITSTCGSDAISKVGDKATDRVGDMPTNQLAQLAMVLVYVGVGLGAALLLFYLASKIWEKATNRTHELNMAKIAAASSQAVNTVEFK